MSSVAVVILNWNTRDYLRRFLPGVLASASTVVVADSGSTDGSMEMLAEEFPQVQRIPLGENLGFTGGYNKALAQVEADYYLLLNSDVEVHEGWLEPLVKWMDTHPECGVCGPKLLSYNDPSHFEYAGAAGGMLDYFGYPYCRGRVLSRIEADHGQYDTPARVFWISGAAMMVRSSLWKELGGLDDRFFAHMEEIDFCWRAQLLGYQVWTVPESSVLHIGGGTLPASSPKKLYFNFRNNLLLLENNLAATLRSPLRARIRILTRMLLDGLAAAAYLLTFRLPSFKAVLHAHRDYRKLRGQKATTAASAVAAEGTVPGTFTGTRSRSDVEGTVPSAEAQVCGFGGLLIFKYICRLFTTD